VTFFRNGDPYFPGLEFRFRPGRDVGTLEALLDKLSVRMDLPRGARYIFSMDGERKLALEELEDGAAYVVSSYKTFKVRTKARATEDFFKVIFHNLIKKLLTLKYSEIYPTLLRIK
ncbi:hypothetical protein AAG570_009449, partial [Ranatra chinensis]